MPGGNEKERVVSAVRVSPGYFDVLRIPIVAGRNFGPADRQSDGILINEAMARLYWPGDHAVGKVVMVGPDLANAKPRRVIGLVRRDDTDAQALRGEPPPPRLYEAVNSRRGWDGVRAFNNDWHIPDVHLTQDRAGSVTVLRMIAARVDPRVRVRTSSLRAEFDRQFAEGRITAWLAGVLGASALALASIGVFGVFAYLVRQQTRDIGVRMALGARSAHVVRDLLRSNARPLAIGLLVGLVAAAAAAQVLRGNLYGLSPFDPIAYAAVLGILAAAAIAAVAVPAWRATRVDPPTALRCE